MGCGYFIALAAWFLLGLFFKHSGSRCGDAAARIGAPRRQPYTRCNEGSPDANVPSAVIENILIACLPAADRLTQNFGIAV
jgi:hypothetical protein